MMQTWPNFGFTVAYVGSGGSSDLATVISQALAGNSVTGTGGITTSASASRTTGVAPMAVFFDATGTTNSLGIDNFADILYIWHFGDTETAWSYGTGVGDNSKNKARGGVAAHVFETAGTYTVKCTPITVSSSGTLSVGTTSSTTITVAAADTTYSGTNTICIANGTLPVAGVGGVPAGATCYNETTWSGVASRFGANKRILLKRGDTWSINTYATVNVSGIQIGAYGTGSKPKLSWTANEYAFYVSGSPDGVTIMDFECDGVSSAASKYIVGGDGNPKANVLMLRVDGYSVGTAISLTPAHDVYVVDCNFHDLLGGSGNVGIFLAASASYTSGCYNLAVLGSRIVDCFAIEHNIRIAGFKVVVSNNTLRQAGTGGKQIVTLRGIAGTPDSTWSSVWAEKLIVSENDFDGGSSGTGLAMQFAPTNVLVDERLRDAICERNWFHGDIGTPIGSEVCNRMTIRNNLFNTTGGETIWIEGKNATSAPIADSTYIYNNVVYDNIATGYGFTYIGKTGARDYPTGTVFRNNLVYAPNASSTVLVSTGAAGSYYTIGNNSSNAQIKSTAPGYTVPPTAVANFKATTGYSIDAGEYVPVFDDFNGAARVPTYDFGGIVP